MDCSSRLLRCHYDMHMLVLQTTGRSGCLRQLTTRLRRKWRSLSRRTKETHSRSKIGEPRIEDRGRRSHKGETVFTAKHVVDPLGQSLHHQS